MKEAGKSGGTQDDVQRVRIRWFPKYRELRHLLNVWPDHTKTHVTRLQQTLKQLTGTPQNPTDWTDPDTWIPKRLSGEDRQLAYAIWTKSDKTVNPRYTGGHWVLSDKYALVSESSNGNLDLTERGREFIDQPFGNTEQLLDQHEGLIALLSIVADLGPAQVGILDDPWAEFLKHVSSPFRSHTTIHDTLNDRLINLLDRGLVIQDQRKYAVTRDGLTYVARAGLPDKYSKVTDSIIRYADEEYGRATLEAFADSTQFSNSINPACWATPLPGRRPDLRLVVGSSIMVALRASSMSVEITLMSAQLDADLRERLQPNRVGDDYKRPKGAARYRLDTREFVEQWPILQKAHREAITEAAAPIRKTGWWPEHRVDAIDSLNRILGRDLPQPIYVSNSDDGPSANETPKPVADPQTTPPLTTVHPEKNTGHQLNQILYGPPGTGKTYRATACAMAIVKGIEADEVTEEHRTEFHSLRFDPTNETGPDRHSHLPPELFLRGLRGRHPAPARRGRRHRLRAPARHFQEHRGRGTGRSPPPLRPHHRRDQPGQHPQDPRRAHYADRTVPPPRPRRRDDRHCCPIPATPSEFRATCTSSAP